MLWTDFKSCETSNNTVEFEYQTSKCLLIVHYKQINDVVNMVFCFLEKCV